MTITYTNHRHLTAPEYVKILRASTLAERRPVDDLPRIQAMVDHADSLWTAWDSDQLVGIARSITDFSYDCYLADLAVATDHQRQGIGHGLVEHLREELGPDVALVLQAAPAAQEYYPKIGFDPVTNAFIIPRRPFK